MGFERTKDSANVCIRSVDLPEEQGINVDEHAPALCRNAADMVADFLEFEADVH